MIISMVNQKGGVGKTTTTINLAAGLASQGKKVLIIDLDPQSSATQSLGYDGDKIEKTIYHVLKDLNPISEAIIHLDHGFDLVPSNILLSSVEIELINMLSREYILKERIVGLNKEYDFLLIDCPPNLGILTINALSASRYLIIPVSTAYLSMLGLKKLMEMEALVKSKINHELQILGILLNNFDQRLNVHKQVVESIKSHFFGGVLNTIIRKSVEIEECFSHQKDIFSYEKGERGIEDFKALTKEIMEKSQGVK